MWLSSSKNGDLFWLGVENKELCLKQQILRGITLGMESGRQIFLILQAPYYQRLPASENTICNNAKKTVCI